MTAPIVDLISGTDPLLRDPPLPHVVELAVLGITTRFETNSRYVLGVVMDSFGAGRQRDGTSREEMARVWVRVVVREGSEPGTPDEHGHAPVQHICPDAARLIAHSPGSVAVSDPARSEAVAYVSTALASDREHFRAAMLEAITFSLLAHLDRHPVHAAAVARDGRAVLMAGPSGSGKSTLSYAAHQAGLRLLSDDRVWVQLEPRLAVWGWPRGVRLLPRAASDFPELSRHAPSWVDGKGKLDVRVDDDRAGVEPVHDVAVCVLERGDGVASLQRIDAGALAESLTRRVDAGFDRYPERQRAVVSALTARGGWRLRLSADPREALPFVLRMLDDG
jgi:hypothetical protein